MGHLEKKGDIEKGEFEIYARNEKEGNEKSM
jgi:hypothetical protein